MQELFLSDRVASTLSSNFLPSVSGNGSQAVRSLLSPLGESDRDFVLTFCGNFNNPEIRAGVHAFLEEAILLVLLEHLSFWAHILGRCSYTAQRCKLDNDSNIKYFNRLDSVDDFLVVTDVVLLPDRSGDLGAKTRTTQLTVLDFPVLGATNAFEGIQMANAYHGAVYTNNDDCREWLMRSLDDSHLRKMLGELALRFAAEEY